MVGMDDLRSAIAEMGVEAAAAFDRTIHNLTLHPPTSPAIGAAMDAVRVASQTMAAAIHLFCPPSRERSLALTALEETVMWGIAAIARNQEEMIGE